MPDFDPKRTLSVIAGGSSNASKPFEKAPMRSDNPRNIVGLCSGIPLVMLKGSAKQNPVGSREHVTGRPGERVSHFWLGQQDCQLATHRMQGLVIE